MGGVAALMVAGKRIAAKSGISMGAAWTASGDCESFFAKQSVWETGSHPPHLATTCGAQFSMCKLPVVPVSPVQRQTVVAHGS